MELVQHTRHHSGDHHSGELVVVPASRTLILRGVPQHLRPKSFDLLLYLMRHRDRLVGREELFEVLWPGAAVSENSLTQCVIDLRKALADDARHPRYIKTVARSGYQFIGPMADPVAVMPAQGIELEEVTTTRVEVESSVGRGLWAAALAVVALSGLAFWLWSKGRPETGLPSLAGRRAVVVMYFENQSQSADLSWLSEGLADMVIANLSKSNKLTVLSRQQLAVSLRRTEAKAPVALPEAMAIATRARANAVVLGSFSKLGERVRIAAQVHDAGSGRLLAVETVTAERPEEILTIVDTLSGLLAADLGATVPARLPRRAVASLKTSSLMTSNLEAYRYYSLGVEQSHAFHDGEAVELFQKAVSLDPGFAMAQARIGYAMSIVGTEPEQGRIYLEKAFQRSGNLTDGDRLHIAAWYAIANQDFGDAIRRYRELLAIDPAETESYMRLGRLLRGEGRYEEAIAVFKQGLAVDPDSGDLLNPLGALYSQLGRHSEAIALEQRYVTVSGGEVNAYDSLGLAYAWAGRPREAERALRRAIELQPGFNVAQRHLATLYAQTGRYRAAVEEGERAIADAPSARMRGLTQGLMAWLLADMGRIEEAERLTEAARSVEPDVGSRFIVALKKGRVREAADLAAGWGAPVLSNRGERPVSRVRTRHYVLGEAALAGNRPQEAIGHFQTALRYWALWSMPALFEDCLASAYLRLGRLDDAIVEYQRVLQLYPGAGLARYHLAVAYQRKGHPALAKAEYQRFLELWDQADPDVAEVVAARAEVQRIQ